MEADSAPALVWSGDGVARALGNWTALEGGLDRAGNRLPPVGQGEPFRLDLSGIGDLDSFGAAALVEIATRIEAGGGSLEVVGASARHAALVASLRTDEPEPHASVREELVLPLTSLGRYVVAAFQDARDVAEVQGRLVMASLNLISMRGPIRLAALVNQFFEIILSAIPVVVLISLVVGIILTQQSIAQLRHFGATIFVVDLGGILTLREMGILLAAIMVAGRSGSAIAAEIGSMKMREEIDALEVIGLDTYRAIVMPRALALLVGLPLLGLVGAIAGIVGSAIVARVSGGISLESFLTRLGGVVDWHIISVGLIKAPFMALAIAVIAVSEGLQVSGSTQSLGRHTTASVVKAIFAVILLDGVFAIFFEAIQY